MPNVEIVAVGTELLLGQLLDTNTPHVARELASAGIDVLGTQAVGDNRQRIARTISAALERADGVVTTGGLGPTVDDLTKEAVCDALALGVETYGPALAQMEAFFAKTGRPMRDNNRKQAELPQGSLPLDNPNGTAPGFIAFSRDGKFVACMPGVPREMKPMLANAVVPFLRERLHAEGLIVTRVVHTIGMGESEVDHRIGDLFRTSENPKIAVLAHDFRADVKIMAKAGTQATAERLIEPVQREIEGRLAGSVFGVDEETPASAVLRALRARGAHLALAESCTGGSVAAALTAIAGASEAFLGGVVAYDNAVKISALGVSPETLERDGAVSEATALEMAAGARLRFGTEIGLATTGIAGPSGGTPQKRVGLVWIAIDDQRYGGRSWRFELNGDRGAVIARATTVALNLLWRHLEGQEP
jgi:nicotinamide-nucleotide amidase